MGRVSIVDTLGIALDDLPPEILKALLAAADGILKKWSSPWPAPAPEDR